MAFDLDALYSESMIAETSVLSEKYSASDPRTALLKILSWATIVHRQAIASSKEGLVPPTE